MYSRKPWGGLLAIGVIIFLLGIVAVVLPGIAALAADLALAWVVLLGGTLQLVYAYQTRKEPGLAWRVLGGVLNIALGLVLLIFPLAGVMALAFFFGALLLAIGINEIVHAFHIRPAAGWGWLLATGIVSALAGVLLAITWPQNSFWVIGFYVGVSMISGGMGRIALALALRRRHLSKAESNTSEYPSPPQAAPAAPPVSPP